MRSARRKQSKTDGKKNRVYSQSPRTSPTRDSPQRFVAKIDYSRLTHEEIRRLGQLRLDRWKSPQYIAEVMQNNPDYQNRMRVMKARSRSEAPPQNVNRIQSTPNSKLASRILVAHLGSEKKSLPHKALECVGRKIQRQLTFAFNGVGQGMRYPDRKPPSKVKC